MPDATVTLLLIGDTATHDLCNSTHHEVLYGRGTDQALVILASCHVDVVVIDMSRAVDAVECCRDLRVAFDHVRLPIVLVGDLPDSEADEHIRGPLQPQDLLEIAADVALLRSHLVLFRDAKTMRLPVMPPTHE